MYLVCTHALTNPPSLDDTGSLGSPLHRVVYPPGSMVPTWVTVSRFFAGNREAELKPTTFSSFLIFCFSVFPLLLNPQRYNAFECCLFFLSPAVYYHFHSCIIHMSRKRQPNDLRMPDESHVSRFFFFYGCINLL